MAAAVATPLEKQFSTIAGIDQMTSLSGQASQRHHTVCARPRHRRCRAGRQFGDPAATKQLPRPCRHPFVPESESPMPIFFLTLTRDPAAFHRQRVRRDFLAQRISTISGVASPGAGQQKYRCACSRPQRARRAASASTRSSRRRQRQRQPAHRHALRQGPHVRHQRQASSTSCCLRPIIVTYRNGAPIRLSELGRVIDSVENDKLAAWFKDQRGITCSLSAARTNTIEVVDAVKKLLPTFRAEVPAG